MWKCEISTPGRTRGSDSLQAIARNSLFMASPIVICVVQPHLLPYFLIYAFLTVFIPFLFNISWNSSIKPTTALYELLSTGPDKINIKAKLPVLFSRTFLWLIHIVISGNLFGSALLNLFLVLIEGDEAASSLCLNSKIVNIYCFWNGTEDCKYAGICEKCSRFGLVNKLFINEEL